MISLRLKLTALAGVASAMTLLIRPPEAVASGITLTDLGAISGPSVYSEPDLTLQGPFAVRRFSAAQAGFNGQFTASDTCGGNAQTYFIDNSRFETIAFTGVTCTITITGAGSATAVIAASVAFAPVTVSPGALQFRAGSPLQDLIAYQPGAAIGETVNCGSQQALGISNITNGEILVAPFLNAGCTIAFNGIGSSATAPVAIAVPKPAVRDGGAFLGSSSFKGGKLRTVTLQSADAERVVALSEAGFNGFQSGVGAGGCTNALGEQVVAAHGFGPADNQVFLTPGANGTCHLYAQGFGGLQQPYAAVVNVPSPSASPSSLTFSGPNQIASIQFGGTGYGFGSIAIDFSSCTGIASVLGDGYHNSATVYPVADGTCNVVGTGFDHQTVTVPVTVSGAPSRHARARFTARARGRAAGLGRVRKADLGIQDLGSLQGVSAYSGGTVTLSSVGAIHAFNLVAGEAWDGAYPGISDTCGGNLELGGYESTTNLLTITIASRNNVNCSMTLSGPQQESLTLNLVENVPNPVAGPSLTLTSASQFATFTASQPGFQPEIQEGGSYCSGSQVSWSGPDASGAFEVQPTQNGSCTLGVGGWAGGTGVATLNVTVAVPQPALADGGALLGQSEFKKETAKKPAVVTLQSSDAFRDVLVTQPGSVQLGVGILSPGSCSNAQGQQIAAYSALGQGLDRVTVSPSHNGLCRLAVSGFGPSSRELDVLVSVPPPALSVSAIAFASLRDEATTVASEPNVKLGGFTLTTTCAGIARVSGPDVYGTIYVTPQANGQCSLTVGGFDGQTASASVSVNASARSRRRLTPAT